MNCVSFAKMDQVFSLKTKNIKTYWRMGKILKKRILSVRNHVVVSSTRYILIFSWESKVFFFLLSE